MVRVIRDDDSLNQNSASNPPRDLATRHVTNLYLEMKPVTVVEDSFRIGAALPK
jgi:hypothetical protein